MNGPDKLNDPFEGDFTIKDVAKYQNEKFIKKLLEFKRKNFIDDFIYDEQLENSLNDEYYFSNILYEYINEIIKGAYGISCFTRNPKNLKMWSHYADSHKGVCLIFDENALRENFINRLPQVSLNEITYRKHLPTVEIVHHDASKDGPDYIGINQQSTDFLFSKLISWKDEKEVRLLLNNDFNVFHDRKLRFEHSCLKGIIFGARMPLENILTILHLVRDSTQLNNLKFYISKKVQKNATIKIEDLLLKN